MNELTDFEKAIQDVLDYGMGVIDNLTPAQIKRLDELFGED